MTERVTVTFVVEAADYDTAASLVATAVARGASAGGDFREIAPDPGSIVGCRVWESLSGEELGRLLNYASVAAGENADIWGVRDRELVEKLERLLDQLEQAQARERGLREALERYENEAPDWLKPIAREALATQSEGSGT